MTGLLPAALLLVIGIAARPADAQVTNRTVDTANGWVFVSLSAPEAELNITDPGSSNDWDIAFLGTEVMLNGGSAGPGGVTATCICQNWAATNDEIQYMTAEGELPDFQSVTAANVPSDPQVWHPATFGTNQWYRYNLRDEHFIWPTYDVYLVKRGDDVYKLQLTGYYGEAGEPRQVTFRTARIAP